MKYSAGQALLFSPFFLAAHLWATTSDAYPADGFSLPYQLSISLGMLLYSFIGLWVLRKFLLRYFSDGATALTLIAIAVGSNYYDYASIDNAMVHNTLFTIYALLLYVTSRYQERWRLKWMVLAGLLIGLATLVRPTEIIALIIPFIWIFTSSPGSRSMVARHFAVMAGVIVLVISIQLIYWKSVGGDWIIYSYGEEGFDWLSPHILQGLISYRSGWLTYSPALIFSLIGFRMLYNSHKKLFVFSLVFFIVFMYICFSWETWWYGGSLGQRAMIQCYPVLSIPMAAFFAYMQRQNRFAKGMTAFLLGLFIVYNLWWTHQAHRGGLLKVGEMTRSYFWAVLGRSTIEPEVTLLLDNPVRHKHVPLEHTLLYRSPADEAGIIRLDNEHPISNEIIIPLPPAGENKLRASADFTMSEKEWDVYKMIRFTIRFYSGNEIVSASIIRPHRIMQDFEKRTVWLDAKMPAKPVDKITLLFDNYGGDKKVTISGVEMISFE